jgi:hypothetical protein
MHLLSLVDPVDDTYRRRMIRQLTVQESRHRLEVVPGLVEVEAAVLYLSPAVR